MSLTSSGWSVVIVGKWNPAILTPAGINKHIFGLEPRTPLPVQIALDGHSPYRVGLPNEEIFVLVDSNQLLFDVVVKDFATLEKSKSLAINALNGLPETPVLAAGWNVNYTNSEVPEKISKIFSTEVDNAFSDEGLSISAHRLGRSFEYNQGVLNMMLTREESGYSINFNFHMNSRSGSELKEWLATPIENVEQLVDQILGIFDEEISEE